jgi:hypothetical protein
MIQIEPEMITLTDSQEMLLQWEMEEIRQDAIDVFYLGFSPDFMPSDAEALAIIWAKELMAGDVDGHAFKVGYRLKLTRLQAIAILKDFDSYKFYAHTLRRT